MKPPMIPWMPWGPAAPPVSTGDSFGCTATACTPGLCALSPRAMPQIVPPVPTPATTMSTLPAVSRQISSAVVATWAAGLAGFSNCWGMKELGVAACSSWALSMQPCMPSAAGVSTSSAPYWRMRARRSTERLSASTMTTR